MYDRISAYPGRVRLTPVEGEENVYDMERADEPSQLGTELKTATLLSDATAALLGLTSDATPNDAIAQLKALQDLLEQKMGYRATGSYVGNDKYGTGNKNSLSFDFEPKMLIINGFAIAAGTKSIETYGNNAYFTWDGKTVSWYSAASASAQLNSSATTYYYLALS